MNSFEAMGQAKLDAAEGQRQLSQDFSRWLGRVAVKWLDAVTRHLPEGRAMPW